MKLTKENRHILRKLGFEPDAKEQWWTREGYRFRIDRISSFSVLLEEMLTDSYKHGKGDGGCLWDGTD